MTVSFVWWFWGCDEPNETNDIDEQNALAKRRTIEWYIWTTSVSGQLIQKKVFVHTAGVARTNPIALKLVGSKGSGTNAASC